MTEVLYPDLCVIGAGSGGLSVAAAAASFGVSVVLVEKGKMGGDCLNYGCVPSKALLAQAKRAQLQRQALGSGAENVPIDFGKIHEYVHGVIRALAPNDSKARLGGLGVQVIEGAAHFKDRFTIGVGDALEIKARRMVIATGSQPAMPSIAGLESVSILTNETIFDLTEVPQHLAVIGAGPVGLELAQAFRRLGAAVTVLEADTPLAKDDPECAAVVLDRLTREGVVIRSGVAVARVEPGPPVRLFLEGGQGEEIIEASHLLVAAARRANVKGLLLEAAGIKYHDRGIVVDKGLRTTNRRVYAIGDVAGGLQFTHVANYHAGLVVRSALFRLPTKADTLAMPWVTFTDPELAQVGLNEVEARRRHGAIRVLRWPYHENDRAQVEGNTVGHIKVITTKRGRIVGASIVGAHAGELITTWSLAVAQRLNIRTIAALIIPYPTLAELGKRAAISYFFLSLTRPWLRSLVRLLRRFG